MMTRVPLISLVLILLLGPGCAGPENETTPDPVETTRDREADAFERLGDLPGLETVVRLSPEAYRGAQPEGEAGMRSLKKLGIRTILSVDSSKDEAALARRHGLHYVEIPLGYDGWSEAEAEAILQVFRTGDGPVYMHCHHGKHRAGSVAAIYRIGIQGWSNERAIRELETLGCSTRYTGIYEDARTWQPSDEDLQ